MGKRFYEGRGNNFMDVVRGGGGGGDRCGEERGREGK